MGKASEFIIEKQRARQRGRAYECMRQQEGLELGGRRYPVIAVSGRPKATAAALANFPQSDFPPSYPLPVRMKFKVNNASLNSQAHGFVVCTRRADSLFLSFFCLYIYLHYVRLWFPCHTNAIRLVYGVAFVELRLKCFVVAVCYFYSLLIATNFVQRDCACVSRVVLFWCFFVFM